MRVSGKGEGAYGQERVSQPGHGAGRNKQKLLGPGGGGSLPGGGHNHEMMSIRKQCEVSSGSGEKI